MCKFKYQQGLRLDEFFVKNLKFHMLVLALVQLNYA